MMFGFIPLLDITTKPPHWEHDEYLALKNMEELLPFRGLSGAWIKPRVRVKMGRREVPSLQDIAEEQIILTVVGNCRRVHTFEEWQNCPSCKMPPLPPEPWWRT